jgi:hypothetical protein
MVDPYVQHRDPDGQPPHQENRSQELARIERATEREVDWRDKPARDAEPSDHAFAFCDNDPIELSERERNYGLYVLGKTGSGKTVALSNAALLDIDASKATIFFDPHGDAARAIMASIPPRRAEKICYLDLSRMNSLAWNPLADVPTHKAALAAINLTDALKDIWPDTWGERLASFLRNGFQLLIEHGSATMRDLPRLYYDAEHRERFTRRIKDPLLNEFWNGEFKSYDDRQRREAQGPILNRMGQFLAIPEIRSVVSHPRSTLKLRTAIDKGYIIIVNLSKGTTGHTPSSIFGSLLASSIKTVLMAREDTPEDERPPLAFYADEFHNYGTIAWAEMLSECRKYGLQLVLAHQFTSQLHQDVLGAVLGNVDTLIVFRVGIADAKLLAPALETGELLYDRDRLAWVQPDGIPPNKLMNQSRFQACMRRGTDHFFIETAPPFPSLKRYDSNLASSDRRFAPRV